MRAVFQRVRVAAVTADGVPAGEIGQGALLLLGVREGDGEAQADRLARKCAELRVFSDESGRMNRSLLDTGGGALVVSNFTLYGSCAHGRRPEFLRAARPEHARPLVDRFIAQLRACGVNRVEAGVFGADMQIAMEADGPVTLLLDTDEWEHRAGETTG